MNADSRAAGSNADSTLKPAAQSQEFDSEVGSIAYLVFWTGQATVADLAREENQN